jgi:hypothetical protein
VDYELIVQYYSSSGSGGRKIIKFAASDDVIEANKKACEMYDRQREYPVAFRKYESLPLPE